MKVYADGDNEESTFYLVSRWTSDGTKFTSSPSFGGISKYYTIDLPEGATLKKVTLFATVGKRWSPVTGLYWNYPRANETPISQIDPDNDKFLRSAEQTFADPSISTKVTFSFRPSGDPSMAGSYTEHLSFENVYLIVEYEPPCSTWHISEDEWWGGSLIEGYIDMNESNVNYSHRLQFTLGNQAEELYYPPVGASYDDTKLYWEFYIPEEWQTEFSPIAKEMPLTILLETISGDSVLGSDTLTINVQQDSSASPSIDDIEFSFIPNVLDASGNSIALQNYNGAKINISGIHGDIWGSTIESVVMSCANGKTYEILKDSNGKDIKGQRDVWLSETVLTEVFKYAGEYPVYARVTDSRGNSASHDCDSFCDDGRYIFVQEYEPIEILGTAQGRENTSSTDNDLDEWYARISFKNYPYNDNVNCNLTLTQLSSDGTETTIPVGDYNSGSKVTFSAREQCLKKDASYKLIYNISDGLTTASVSRLVGSSYAFMRWEPGDNAIGFGCYPGGSNRIEISSDWDCIVNGNLKIYDETSNSIVSIKEFIQNIVTNITNNL